MTPQSMAALAESNWLDMTDGPAGASSAFAGLMVALDDLRGRDETFARDAGALMTTDALALTVAQGVYELTRLGIPTPGIATVGPDRVYLACRRLDVAQLRGLLAALPARLRAAGWQPPCDDEDRG